MKMIATTRIENLETKCRVCVCSLMYCCWVSYIVGCLFKACLMNSRGQCLLNMADKIMQSIPFVRLCNKQSMLVIMLFLIIDNCFVTFCGYQSDIKSLTSWQIIGFKWKLWNLIVYSTSMLCNNNALAFMLKGFVYI